MEVNVRIATKLLKVDLSGIENVGWGLRHPERIVLSTMLSY